MAILSDTSITLNGSPLQVNGSVSFQYIGSSVQHLKLFCSQEITPNVEIGFAKQRNEIFSNSRDIYFGSLSNALNINFLVQNNDRSGFVLRANDVTNNSKTYGKLIASRNSSGVLTTNCEISVNTEDANGRANIQFRTRSGGSLSTIMEIEPSVTKFNKTPILHENLILKNTSQYINYVIGTVYNGSTVSGYTKHTDYNNAVVVLGSVNVTGYDRNDYDSYYSASTRSWSTKVNEGEHARPGCVSVHGSSNSIVRLYSKASTNNYWEMFYSTSAATNSWANDSLRFRYNGATKGWINPTDDGKLLSFTGQHRLKPESNLEIYKNSVGMIVVSFGKYQNLDSKDKIEINEALPIIELSNRRNQKNVIGVISDSEDIESNQRSYLVGAFGTVLEKEPTEEDTRLYINSIGEGGIWVCNINGSLENGDYITTCEIPGYGMKQDDEFLHNYTVAKITCDCDFNLESPIYICEEFQWEGQTYRRAFVGCTYHCG